MQSLCGIIAECSIPVHEHSKDTKEAAEHDLHSREDENRTILDGTLLLDPTNKISANYVFDSRSLKLRYSYVHRGIATFEPCHDFGKNSWELAVSKTVFDGDVIRASYDTSRRFWTLSGCGNPHSTEMDDSSYATTLYDLQFMAGTFLFDGIVEKILRFSGIWD